LLLLLGGDAGVGDRRLGRTRAVRSGGAGRGRHRVASAVSRTGVPSTLTATPLGTQAAGPRRGARASPGTDLGVSGTAGSTAAPPPAHGPTGPPGPSPDTMTEGPAAGPSPGHDASHRAR